MVQRSSDRWQRSIRRRSNPWKLPFVKFRSPKEAAEMISLQQILEQERQANIEERLAENHRQHRLVRTHAHAALQSRQECDELQRELAEFEASDPIPSEGDHARATTSRLFAFFVLAAYAIDFALAA